MRIRTPVGPIHIVGELLEPADGRQRLRRRDGQITKFDPADVEAARVVPDPRSVQISADDLDRIGVLGWRPIETEPLGNWLLRYGHGFTRRANTCLAVGDPGIPFDAAVGSLTTWYEDRDLTPAVHVVAGSQTEAEFNSRGFEPTMEIVVMTAEVGHVLRAAAANQHDLELRLNDLPDAGWINVWRNTTDPIPDELLATAIRHDNVAFVSLNEGGRPIAVARVGVDGRWGGLFAVAVEPMARGRGLGRAITLAAIKAAGQRGARHIYLQVLDDNLVARSLYTSLGFKDHHSYRYLARP